MSIDKEAEAIREALTFAASSEDYEPIRMDALVALDSLLAYIKQLEGERDHWKQEAAGLASEQRVAEAAEAENERLREALERLASSKTRLRIDQGQGIGKFARAALAACTEEPRSHPRSAEITRAYREQLDIRTDEK